MKSTIEEIAEALAEANKKNLSAESFEYVDSSDFPQEYKSLIHAVNRSLQLGELRYRQEKSRLELINDIIKSGMWSMEFNRMGELTKVVWTQAFRDMLGFKDTNDFPDVLESWSDRLAPEDKEKTLKAYWNAVDGKQKYDVEYRLLTKNDGYRWYRATGETVRRQDGTARFLSEHLSILRKEKSMIS